MTILFKKETNFAILFVSILLLDIYVKLNCSALLFRFISKPLIVLSILAYYLINNKETSKKKHHYMIVALLVYLIGDWVLIFYENTTLFMCGLLLFISAKLLYAVRFSNERTFNIICVVPFLSACFAYMVIILFFVLDKLESFLIPVVLYLFGSMVLNLFAVLRKGAVTRKSFNFVMVGIFFAVICDSVALFQSFYYEGMPHHETLIMLAYGVSQYFIVRGVVEETKYPIAY